MKYSYKTNGTCSTRIDFEMNGDTVSDIKFTNGCNGNLKAISKLLEGQSADYIIEKLSGNTCGWRQTSCADQLATAVREAKEGKLKGEE